MELTQASRLARLSTPDHVLNGGTSLNLSYDAPDDALSPTYPMTLEYESDLAKSDAHGASNHIIFGTALSDKMNGSGSNDTLCGLSETDTMLGRGTRDLIFGRGGRDVFVLGDSRGAFYNDGKSQSAGRTDYVSIRDFSNGDVIKLAGSASDYIIRTEQLGRTGSGIYLDSNQNRVWDQNDELIAHVSGSFAPKKLTSTAFSFTPKALQNKEVRVADAQELDRALSDARGGETIVLTGSDYGNLLIKRVNPSSEVIIRSDYKGEEAQFQKIVLADSSNITFESIDIQFAPLAGMKTEDNLVRVYKSENVTFRNVLFQGFDATDGVDPASRKLDSSGMVKGLPVGRGLQIHESSDVTVEDSVFTNLTTGLAIIRSDDVSIKGNEIFDLRRTGLQVSGAEDLSISGNHIHSINPWNLGGSGDHGDFIHIFSAGRRRSDNSNIDILNNLIEEGDGKSVLGIYVDDNNRHVGFENLSIINNVMFIGEHQAIRLENVHGEISNNTLIQASGTFRENPLIFVRDGSAVTMRENISGGIHVIEGSSARQAYNYHLQRQDLGASHYSSILDFDASDGIDLADAALLTGTVADALSVGANLDLFSGWRMNSNLGSDFFAIA